MKPLCEVITESINESLLDSFDKLNKASLKEIQTELKTYVKTKIFKSSGRIKLDAKTGKITLPSNGYIEIQCPIHNAASFEPFEPGAIVLKGATEDDLIKVCQNIDKNHSYELRLYNSPIKKFPTIFDGISLDKLRIEELRSNLDFNNIKLKLNGLYIESFRGTKKKITGTENISVVGDEGLKLHKVEMTSNFGDIDISSNRSWGGIIRVEDTKAPETLFKKLKNAIDIEIRNSSNIDLSSCKCNRLDLQDIDSTYDCSLLPKQVTDYISIYSSDEYENFDFSNLKSKIEKLIFNGVKIDLNMSKEERGVALDFGLITSGKEISQIPESVINYMEKNTKEIKDFDGMSDGKSYVILSAALFGNRDSFDVISYFENFKKVKNPEHYSRKYSCEGWVISYEKDNRYDPISHKKVQWSKCRRNQPDEAEAERFYKDKGEDQPYYITKYRIFEIPSNIQQFVRTLFDV